MSRYCRGDRSWDWLKKGDLRSGRANSLMSRYCRGDRSWDWLKKGDLKKETEGRLTAAHDEALRTNAMKASIEKQDVSLICRMCREKDETINHLICECNKVVQIYYRPWHDNVARMIHWNILRKET